MKTTLRRVLNIVFTFRTLLNMVSASRRSPQGLLKYRQRFRPGSRIPRHLAVVQHLVTARGAEPGVGVGPGGDWVGLSVYFCIPGRSGIVCP